MNRQTIDDQKFRKILDKLQELTKDIFFVEIGAFDGVSGDPIYHSAMKYKWHGILVEPILDYYNKLCENYSSNSNVSLENVAIDRNSGQQIMYRIDNMSNSALSLNFNFDNVENIREEQVQVITIEELLNKHQVTKIDLLHIDAEGKDHEIIQDFNLDKYSPKVINFEANPLSSPEMVELAVQKLVAYGYTIYNHKWDQAHYDITAIKGIQF